MLQALGGGGQIRDYEQGVRTGTVPPPVYGSSGSGAGGRVAVYHSTHRLVPPYRGDYWMYSGAVGAHAEAGASGTAYLHHVPSNYTVLLVDNKGRKPKVRRAVNTAATHARNKQVRRTFTHADHLWT